MWVLPSLVAAYGADLSLMFQDWQNAKVYYEKSMLEHRTPESRALLSEAECKLKDMERKAYIDPVKAEEEKEMGNDLFKKGELKPRTHLQYSRLPYYYICFIEE